MQKPPLPPGSGKPLPWPVGPHVAAYKYKITNTAFVAVHISICPVPLLTPGIFPVLLSECQTCAVFFL